MRSLWPSLALLCALAATARAQDFEAAGKHFAAAQEAFGAQALQDRGRRVRGRLRHHQGSGAALQRRRVLARRPATASKAVASLQAVPEGAARRRRTRPRCRSASRRSRPRSYKLAEPVGAGRQPADDRVDGADAAAADRAGDAAADDAARRRRRRAAAARDAPTTPPPAAPTAPRRADAAAAATPRRRRADAARRRPRPSRRAAAGRRRPASSTSGPPSQAARRRLDRRGRHARRPHRRRHLRPVGAVARRRDQPPPHRSSTRPASRTSSTQRTQTDLQTLKRRRQPLQRPGHRLLHRSRRASAVRHGDLFVVDAKRAQAGKKHALAPRARSSARPRGGLARRRDRSDAPLLSLAALALSPAASPAASTSTSRPARTPAATPTPKCPDDYECRTDGYCHLIGTTAACALLRRRRRAARHVDGDAADLTPADHATDQPSAPIGRAPAPNTWYNPRTPLP